MFIDTLGMFHPTKYNNLEYIILALYKEATKSLARKAANDQKQHVNYLNEWRKPWDAYEESPQKLIEEVKKYIKESPGLKFGKVNFSHIGEVDLSGLDFSDPKKLEVTKFDEIYGPGTASIAIRSLEHDEHFSFGVAKDILTATFLYLIKRKETTIEQQELNQALFDDYKQAKAYVAICDAIVAKQAAEEAIKINKEGSRSPLKFDKVNISNEIFYVPLDLSNPLAIDTTEFNKFYRDMCPINEATKTGLAERIFAEIGIVSLQQREAPAKEVTSPRGSLTSALRKQLGLSIDNGNGSNNVNTIPSSPKSPVMNPARVGSPPKSPILDGSSSLRKHLSSTLSANSLFGSSSQGSTSPNSPSKSQMYSKAGSPPSSALGRSTSPTTFTPGYHQSRAASPSGQSALPKKTSSSGSLFAFITGGSSDGTTSPNRLNSPRGTETSGLHRSLSAGSKSKKSHSPNPSKG